jgi:hypothetical protein
MRPRPRALLALAAVLVAACGSTEMPSPTSSSDPTRAQTATPQLSPTGTPITLSLLGIENMAAVEVEPGVYLVLNDGVRDLVTPLDGYPNASVDITPDGSVWVTSPSVMYRLGDERPFSVPRVFPPFLEVGPDGTLWALEAWESTVRSFDGELWRQRTAPTGDDLLLEGLAIGPDGAAWLAASDRDKRCADVQSEACSGTALLRVEDDGSMTPMDDWADVHDGEVAWDEVAVSPDGDVWLIAMDRSRSLEAQAMLRFDGSGWELVPGPDGFVDNPLGRSMAFGPDGTLWAATSSTPESTARHHDGLARFDDPGWTAFTVADGVQDWGGQGWFETDLLAVAQDGSLWMNGTDAGGCGGVAHYQGATWTSYLRAACVHDLAIAPDGSVWLRASDATSWEDEPGTVGTYVVIPEIAARTGSGTGAYPRS